MKVLILGASGMLGNAMMRIFGEDEDIDVFGTTRSNTFRHSSQLPPEKIISGLDVNNIDTLIGVMRCIKPDVVINCVGLIKQLKESNNPMHALPINSIFPHRLEMLVSTQGSRLVHISTDCVFSGLKGNYKEDDVSDAIDLYGKSKYLGEVACKNSVTLRTSIIGHELNTCNGLVDWFLRQQGTCLGYENAIFSGLPTVVLAKIIKNIVIPKKLTGLYHIGSEPISKFNLLKIIAEIYKRDIKIVPDRKLRINRSLCFEKFSSETGYQASPWIDLIRVMYEYQK